MIDRSGHSIVTPWLFRPEIMRARFLMAALLPAMACADGASADISQTTLLDLGYRQMYSLDFAAPTGHSTPGRTRIRRTRWVRFRMRRHTFCRIRPPAYPAIGVFRPERHFPGSCETAANPMVRKNSNRAGPRPEARGGQTRKGAEGRNALFASFLRMGLRADYLALIEKRYLASLSEIKTGRLLAEQLLAKDPSCYDAYLAIGVENYMLSFKPAPVRWLLRIGGAQTDKERGHSKTATRRGEGPLPSPLRAASVGRGGVARSQPGPGPKTSEIPGRRISPQPALRTGTGSAALDPCQDSSAVPVRQCGKDYWLAPINIEPDDNDDIPSSRRRLRTR